MSILSSSRKFVTLFAVIAACVLFSAATVRADPVTFVLQGPAFSSNTPLGSINITITQSTANSVQFSITNNTDGDIDDLYFNNILASTAWGTASGCTQCSAILFGSDAFKADGDGFYDLQVMFPSSGGSHGPDRFAPGDTVVFTVSATGITPESFLAFSAPGGGAGPFQVAAHVISIDSQSGQSGWISDQPVPEPATLLLLGSGLVGIAANLRRRRH